MTECVLLLAVAGVMDDRVCDVTCCSWCHG